MTFKLSKISNGRFEAKFVNVVVFSLHVFSSQSFCTHLFKPLGSSCMGLEALLQVLYISFYNCSHGNEGTQANGNNCLSLLSIRSNAKVLDLRSAD